MAICIPLLDARSRGNIVWHAEESNSGEHAMREYAQTIGPKDLAQITIYGTWSALRPKII
jgi:hypothetical protein